MTVSYTYTTYDIRRCQDTIKPALQITSSRVVRSGYTARCNVMLMSDEDDGQSQHQFWYAKVLGIFHCMVRSRSAPHGDYERMDLLWIRWLGVDPDRRVGGSGRRLDRVGYVPDSEYPGAFGFVDPADVIRGCQLIPCFDEGMRDDLLADPSSVSDLEGEDYRYHYIMRFVDRDMAMRYRGGGIGHLNQCVQADTAEYPGTDNSDSESEGEGYRTDDEEIFSNDGSTCEELEDLESRDSDVEDLESQDSDVGTETEDVDAD